MKLKEVVAEVESIKACAGDAETAHSMEDNLYAALLQAIAAGDCEDPAACAEAALVTLSFDFPRWCA